MYFEKTPDDGQGNCPKHVEFYSKNKFEKLVHLIGFIVRRPHIRCTNLFVLEHLNIMTNSMCTGFISRG